MLVGREHECARLDALISRVRSGASAAIVIEGEAGIGKTSLLEYAISHADGLRVLMARGVESEQNLPFAGLADLIGPALRYLGTLPGPQRAALASALGIGPIAPAERFTICAATLNLLGTAAAKRPILAVVDDAHLLDAASAQAVEFTARRLGEEALGLIVAVRGDAPGLFHPGRMNSITLMGLDRAAARELLGRTGRTIVSSVAERLVQGVGGNPLALLELATTLTDAELSGQALLPEPLPVAEALRSAFAQRLNAIAPAARRLLLLAAADAGADLATLQRASRELSLDLAGLSAAEEADLVRVGAGRVEFTHPLLRSIAYHTARPTDRRAAHRALAHGMDSGQDPIRKAWHLASASIGPDEKVADSLDHAAHIARARNAFAAASRAYQRAAELTADPSRGVSRWMAAGEAAHLGGDLRSASRLLSRAVELAADPRVRADAQVMRAHATLWMAPLTEHHQELVSEADAVLPVDRLRAATLLALAASLCIMTGEFGLALETAARAVGLSGGAGGVPWLLSRAILASASILTGNRTAGRLLIADIGEHPDFAGEDPPTYLLRILCGQALIWCEEYGTAGELLRSSVAGGRTLGRLADLPYGLAILADLHFRTGEWGQAYSDATEAVELGTDFATTNDLCYALVCAARIEATMGAETLCRAHLDTALTLAKPTGVGPTITAYAAAARGLLEMGRANYRNAVAELIGTASILARHGLRDPNVIQWRPDYIESLIRIGHRKEAQEQLALLDSETAATGSQWARAAGARCHGLLQDSPQHAIAQLEEAVAIAEKSASVFEQARARLCLGEALRRGRRRRDARRQLGQAQSAFELLGAGAWAERAALELRATGITAVPRREPIHGRLTAQELRVALQVAQGLSNREVATRLFLSPKTVEVHLGHIYQKLGLHSRTSLAVIVNSGLIPELSSQAGTGRHDLMPTGSSPGDPGKARGRAMATGWRKLQGGVRAANRPDHGRHTLICRRRSFGPDDVSPAATPCRRSAPAVPRSRSWST